MKLFIIMKDGEMYVKAYTPTLCIVRTETHLIITDYKTDYTESYLLDEISTLLILK